MSEKILVPVLGESITEATVAKWLKQEGDTVEADEAIVELETDKVNLEVPSPIDGVLSEINSKDGETVEVGALLGTISQNGTQPSEKKIITKIEPKKTENNVVNLEIKKEVPKVFEEPEEEKPLILINEVEEENKAMSFKMKIEDIPIYLHINSYGGCVFSAFNIIDVIEACSVPIYSIVEGCAASAGTLMSVVCDKKYIRKNSYMLIHQLSSGCWGKMCEIEDEVENLTDFMDKIKQIYMENTKIPKRELTELLKHDLWLNSNKCLKYELAEEIM